MKYFRRFAYLTVIAILVLIMGMYKPPLKNVTTGELDAISRETHGESNHVRDTKLYFRAS